MKRITALLLALLLTLPTYALAADMTYEVSPYVSYADGNVNVYVYVSGVQNGYGTSSVVYNAFQLIFLYDASMLKFVGAEVCNASSDRQIESKATGGTVTVSGCGANVNSANSPIILHFTPQKAGTTKIQLIRALVSSRSSVREDAKPSATKDTDSCKNGVLTVTTGSFKVALGDSLGLIGNSSVESGKDYTFRGSPYYDYTLTAKIGSSQVNIMSNSDGTFTVKSVNGALTVSGSRTPKSYDVTVSGSGSGDMSYSGTPTYGENFTFTVKKSDLSDYAVTATVGGRAVSLLDNDDNSYTIAGSSIIGNIEITVSKAAQSNTTLVIFSGSGAEDVDGGTERTVKTGVEFQFAINMKDDYDYAVLLNGQSVPYNESNAYYYIPANMVTGSILAVTVTKTPKMSVTVTVSDYSATKDNQRAYLIVAKSDSLQAGQCFLYEESPMYYSQAYGGFAWVLAAGTTPTAEAVKSKLTVGTEAYSSVTLNGDVNDTGFVDVNDAQLAYDMYLGQCSFTEYSQMMWLRADANGDKTLSVTDVQTVLEMLTA